ncbi:MAG: ribonuclease P protein component [Patescibacteria group bacterium]
MTGRVTEPQKLPTVEYILKKGRRYENPLFTLWALDKKRTPFRSYVICSRKVDKRATRRNLLKRRIREILRKDFAKFYQTSDIAVRIKPVGNGKKAIEFKKALTNVFHIS